MNFIRKDTDNTSNLKVSIYNIIDTVKLLIQGKLTNNYIGTLSFVKFNYIDEVYNKLSSNFTKISMNNINK